MEIIQNKIVVKLDKEERDNLIETIDLLKNMTCNITCDIRCPFRQKCDECSPSQCWLEKIIKDLTYINNYCD